MTLANVEHSGCIEIFNLIGDELDHTYRAKKKKKKKKKKKRSLFTFDFYLLPTSFVIYLLLPNQSTRKGIIYKMNTPMDLDTALDDIIKKRKNNNSSKNQKQKQQQQQQRQNNRPNKVGSNHNNNNIKRVGNGRRSNNNNNNTNGNSFNNNNNVRRGGKGNNTRLPINSRSKTINKTKNNNTSNLRVSELFISSCLFLHLK